MSAVILTPAQTAALRPLLEAKHAPRFVLIGATALSAHLPLERPTYDLDLVFVAAPSEYEKWFDGFGWSRSTRMEHRWALGDVYVDVLPGTEEVVRAGQVQFNGGTVMSTVGFDLVLEHAEPVKIATTELVIEVASLASLVVLKLAAWFDRQSERAKDLDDLMQVLRRALPEDAECRWDNEHPVYASGTEFEFQSAFHVGSEVARVIEPTHGQLLDRFLAAAQDEDSACFGRLALAYTAYGDPFAHTQRAIRAFQSGLRFAIA